MKPATPILRARRFIWPVVLFPYAIERSHTRVFTGREWVSNVKGGITRASVELSDTAISLQGLLLGRRHLRIPLDQVDYVSLYEHKPGLVAVSFRQAMWGLLARFVTSGQPPGDRNRVILNVKKHEAWLSQIEARIP